MKLYSTKNRSLEVSLQEAVFKGLPEDNGLYMPVVIPRLPDSFVKNLKQYTFQEIGFEISKALFQGEIPDSDLHQIIDHAINFPAPVIALDEDVHVLELFHGPSLAFKDFGARFMSQLMSYFNRGESKELVILVATSGDTGGAVAAGFYKIPGIRVVILYPSGKVSELQECQLTTLGHNVSALEISGTFDDCQAMVKQAFLDQSLRDTIRLSSANSINIARLIPQSFYYFEAFKQVNTGRPIVFSVPSGNFGNLTAGLLAREMGLPVYQFLAATNVNDVVPQYLSTGFFSPKPSIRTLSNAMDVGNPSNFSRMMDLIFYKDECSTWNKMNELITGYAIDDEFTKRAMVEVYDQYGYIMDPHGAVGYLALKCFQGLYELPASTGIVLETAHPSKFKEDVDTILEVDIEVPKRLAELADKPKMSFPLPPHYDALKNWLLDYIT